ncbi:copine-5-like isoform X3 [Passer montanus]|uniref:copine-5-like isoform X3 n=1 Tax=Passer montanus TaxID=9160 RepID=UPI00195FE344|nr:copine-5-like isoform X3 [Passer montanus]
MVPGKGRRPQGRSRRRYRGSGDDPGGGPKPVPVSPLAIAKKTPGHSLGAGPVPVPGAPGGAKGGPCLSAGGAQEDPGALPRCGAGAGAGNPGRCQGRSRGGAHRDRDRGAGAGVGAATEPGAWRAWAPRNRAPAPVPSRPLAWNSRCPAGSSWTGTPSPSRTQSVCCTHSALAATNGGRYDVDSKSPDLSKHDFLGQAFCTLGEIIGSAGSRLEKPLTSLLVCPGWTQIPEPAVAFWMVGRMGTAAMHPRGRRPAPAVSNGGILGKKCGTIILLAEELGNCRDVATLQFCASKLDKKDFFGKSDPFMVFYRSNEDGTFTICHKTEVVRNTLNPVWAAFAIPVRALCNGDHDRAIKVEVYDWDRDGSHDFIGEFTTSYRELARGQSHFNVYEVVNPRKKMKKKKYLNSGTVTLLSFAVEAEHTFLDYIRGGTQLNFTVAIDFTASNGNPSQPTSLHYLSPFQLNAYSLALRAVGDIIQDYDSDKMFPALGFGAKVPPDGHVSHEFPLNGDASNPACHGIAGVLEAYQRSLRHVQLYGPTNFAPVVNHVARPRRPSSMLPNCPCPLSSWELARLSLMPWWSWMGTTSASLPVGKWLSVISSSHHRTTTASDRGWDVCQSKLCSKTLPPKRRQNLKISSQGHLC